MGTAKGLLEELVVILEKVRAELTAGTREGMQVVQIEVMRERFDDAIDDAWLAGASRTTMQSPKGTSDKTHG